MFNYKGGKCSLPVKSVLSSEICTDRVANGDPRILSAKLSYSPFARHNFAQYRIAPRWNRLKTMGTFVHGVDAPVQADQPSASTPQLHRSVPLSPSFVHPARPTRCMIHQWHASSVLYLMLMLWLQETQWVVIWLQKRTVITNQG